jgi:purine-nucleoside phosphorylase
MTAAAFRTACARDKYSVDTIVAFLRGRIAAKPDVGVICGSGLNDLDKVLDAASRVAFPYSDIPGFPQSTVAGHTGELVFGTLGGTNVMLMRGRFHFYEGYEPSRVSLPVRVMAALGVRVVVVTNASGGVNTTYRIGDFMIIQDHISFPGLSGTHPLVSGNVADCATGARASTWRRLSASVWRRCAAAVVSVCAASARGRVR